DEIADTRREENRLTQLLSNPSLTTEERAALQAKLNMVVYEDGQIALAIYQLDLHYAPNNKDSDTMTRYYNNPNVLMGGSGSGDTTIYGGTFPNYILAGNGPGRTFIYSGGADDTITGTAGKDIFYVPSAPDNANIVFTAQDDGHGNLIPVVDIDTGRLQ